MPPQAGRTSDETLAPIRVHPLYSVLRRPPGRRGVPFSDTDSKYHLPWGCTMELLDWVVVGLYFLVLLGVGWWVIRQRQESSADYFLAGRNIGWFVIGASLFASNIGSEHLVGLAGTGAKDGVAMAHYELHAWCLLVLGWVLVPFYARSLVFTMPEFLERRYSPAARWFLSVVSLISYVFTKVAVGLFAAGIVLRDPVPRRPHPGAEQLLGRGDRHRHRDRHLHRVGRAASRRLHGSRPDGRPHYRLSHHYLQSASTRSAVGAGSTRSAVPRCSISGSRSTTPDFPWLGMLIGAPIVGLWYWCTDQYIVQRTLAAANIKEARRGTIFAAYMKMLPLFIFIVPGMLAFAPGQDGRIRRRRP